MEPNDKDLKQQLSRGPLIKHGFDARLVARIEEAIERPDRRRHPLLRFGWHGAGLAAMAVLLLFAGLWHWSFGSGGPAGTINLQRAGQTAGTDAPLFADADAELHSALLLGLRADPKSEDGSVVSSYRTLFIAPEDGQFELSAQGDGIVMPYGQNFWKIEAVSSDAGSPAPAQKLIAYPVTGKEAAKTDVGALRETSAAPLAERLLFVGNKYVSVEQNPSDAPQPRLPMGEGHGSTGGRRPAQGVRARIGAARLAGRSDENGGNRHRDAGRAKKIRPHPSSAPSNGPLSDAPAVGSRRRPIRPVSLSRRSRTGRWPSCPRRFPNRSTSSTRFIRPGRRFLRSNRAPRTRFRRLTRTCSLSSWTTSSSFTLTICRVETRTRSVFRFVRTNR
ncbi:hypothetical protein [Cohnella rhizosphaerae]|uniref:Uncharacterized protein n=1 Tax=Cohnella rhizosphaerae TaxID=1457232 RepID=A0A9X4KYF1_9BACL|nr:hypothetical protein [Cohnella rhizosphaerae]MDG0813063.1 hypothetical protein [Cohnella rhizosphaerae]